MSASKEIRILMADDHPFFLDGLTANLETEPDFKIIARANDGRQALAPGAPSRDPGSSGPTLGGAGGRARAGLLRAAAPARLCP